MKNLNLKAVPIMKTFLCKCLAPALVLLLAAGCVFVDYVGQTFEPIPEGKPVDSNKITRWEPLGNGIPISGTVDAFPSHFGR